MTFSLFDRFTTLLKVGGRSPRDDLPGAGGGVRDAGVTLLRGERCHLVQVAHLEDDRLTTQSGEPVDDVSRTLLAQR
jgi:hypothetical protein